MRSETRLFEFRKHAREGRKAQLLERITQYDHEVEGLKAQEVAYADGIVVLETEIAALQGLRRQGIVSDQRLNGLKTQLATFGGERGEKIAYQAQTAGRISETRLQILSIDQDLRSEVSDELRDIQGQLGEFVERKVAAEDQLAKIELVAPVSSVVHQLKIHTVGGVISPAEQVMTIVPETDDLVLEVKIAPRDIDQLELGHKALVRMSAFSQRTTPELHGVVSRISADVTEDERTGLAHYLVRISVPPEEQARLGDLALLPGMPGDTYIETSKRTALSYLLKPLSDQVKRAFREE